MNINSINYSYTANAQTKPKNRSIASVKPVSSCSISQVEACEQIKEFKEKGDLEGYAKFLNSKQFPLQRKTISRGRYIADYFRFLQQQAKEKLGSQISLKITKKDKNYSYYFADKDPQSFFYVYDTIAKYKTLDEITIKDSEISDFLKPEPVYPRNVLIRNLSDAAGDNDDSGKIRLERDLFKKEKLGFDDIDTTFEHEIGHLKDNAKNGFEQDYSYLDILEPNEKKLYQEFDETFTQKIQKFIKKFPNKKRV